MRQRSCADSGCRKKRKKAAQDKWVAQNPDYYYGRYEVVKLWRQQRRTARAVIQDERPTAKPVLKLVFIVPATAQEMIQDEIILRRVAPTAFAAAGLARAVIQDAMALGP
jgi:hypothetical protein